MGAEPKHDFETRSLVYATHDGVALSADLYVPKGEGPFALAISVPGGGWRICDRAGHRGWGAYLAKNGTAALAIDYRVNGGKSKIFPAPVHDVIAAIQYARGNAAELKIDPARIGIVATSAGAHLSALAVLAGEHPLYKNAYPKDAYAGVDTGVKCFAGIYGVYDMFAHWQADLVTNAPPGQDMSEAFLGATPYDDQQLYFDASPIKHITYAKNKMPVLLTWGTEDIFVRPAQSESFMAALRQAGFRVLPYPVQGAGHFWFSEPIEEQGSYMQYLAPRLLRFLKQNL